MVVFKTWSVHVEYTPARETLSCAGGALVVGNGCEEHIMQIIVASFPGCVATGLLSLVLSYGGEVGETVQIKINIEDKQADAAAVVSLSKSKSRFTFWWTSAFSKPRCQ